MVKLVVGVGFGVIVFICHKSYQRRFFVLKIDGEFDTFRLLESTLYCCGQSAQGGLPTSVKIDGAKVTGQHGWYWSTKPNQIVWFLGDY